MSNERPTEWDTDVSRTDSEDRPQHGDIPRDDLFELLASERRRAVVSYLATGPADAAQLEELVAVLVANECPGSGPGTHRERVSTAIHHVHLPKLERVGVLSYDPRSGAVHYHGSERLEALLAASDDVADEDG